MDIQTIKAVGDWELEVLGVPYYGPNAGKDSDSEYFDERTNLHEDKFPLPPAVYYHGYSPEGEPMGDPAFIGKTISAERRQDGVWYRVLLDKTSELARRVWEAAKENIARASSGSIAHLVRKERNGHITHWPVAELSIFDIGDGRQPANGYAVALPVLKSTYQTAGIAWPGFDEPEAISGAGLLDPAEAVNKQGNEPRNKSKTGAIKMDEKEKQALFEAAKAEGRKELEKEIEAQKARERELEEARAEAVKMAEQKWEAEKKALEAEAAKGRRLPEGVNIAKHSNLWKYDNLSLEDQAVLVGVLNSTDGATGESRHRASEDAMKALAMKAIDDKGRVGVMTQHALKATSKGAFKSDEIQQQDLSSYGDDWVGVAYSQALWEAIRAGTFVAANIPSIEVPPGHESVVIPLESGDPTFYKVAEATATQTSGWPNTTITSSQMGTAKQTMSLAKMGARTLWSGELQEDSLIPFISQLRMQLEKAGAEQLEHAIIDGDNATASVTNINDIGSTGVAGTELFLLFDGFRVSPLVTTAANSRSGGVLTVEDYLETLKLMGTAGLNAADPTKVAFIQDPNVAWKAMELEEVKTRDSYYQPSIENGKLTQLWGYKVYTSYFMHYKSAVRKANSAGKIDQDTTSNNTTGSLLAVRWDQWLLGYRRRMTMETTRIARADTTEIVALMRLGLTQRDTEAAAITYNITV